MPPLSNWNMPFVSPRQKQGERLLVVERKLEGSICCAGGLLDQVDHLREDRQVAQAEEVHLQQAGPLDVAHGPLGDDFLLCPCSAPAARGRSRSAARSAITTAAACVPTLRARPSIFMRQVEQLADLGILVVGLLQIVALPPARPRA